MLQINPKYVLKNYMLQNAITLAEHGDYSMVDTVLYIAQHPFEELPEFEHFARETSEEHKNITLSKSIFLALTTLLGLLSAPMSSP